jgi:hypothetical protein
MSTVVEAPGELERLWCETGEHHFERPLVRGVKPVACPEHRAERARLEQQRRRRAAKPKPVVSKPPRRIRADGHGKFLDPIYGHVADASIAFHTGDLAEMVACLKRLAGAAELIALSVPSGPPR